MKIRAKLILSNLVIILIAVSIGCFFIFEVEKTLGLVKQSVPEAIKELSNKSYLDSLAQFIKYYDEVLTQSARNYAFTGDKKWKDRYYSVVNDLDAKIKDAIAKGDDIEKIFFETVDKSNIALVKMEEQSFALVDAGDKTEAVKVLESAEYLDQKKIYTDSLTEYLVKRGAQYQQTLVVSTKAVEDASNNISDSISKLVSFFILGIIAGIIIALLIAIYLSKIIIKPLRDLKSATQEIIKGNLNKKINVKTKDEFKDLADSFNIMADKLKKNIEQVEQKVKDRTKELETLNKYMTGRELKMIELKKQIGELEKNKNNK